MNTWEVLEAAADKIERDGWQQGGYGTRTGPTCAMGAMSAVRYGEANCAFDYLEAAPIALARALGGTPDRIPTWNDANDRTADEVIAMLRAVAATEKARAARLLPVVREPVTA